MDHDERQRYLTVYFNDHLAGATVGTARFARSARAHRGSDVGIVLEGLRREVAQDRRVLLHSMRLLGVSRRWPLELAARVGEAVGALKPNGRVLRSSPLRTVVEIEGLLLGVAGKVAGWRSLLELAATDDRLDADTFAALIQRAER